MLHQLFWYSRALLNHFNQRSDTSIPPEIGGIEVKN